MPFFSKLNLPVGKRIPVPVLIKDGRSVSENYNNSETDLPRDLNVVRPSINDAYAHVNFRNHIQNSSQPLMIGHSLTDRANYISKYLPMTDPHC